MKKYISYISILIILVGAVALVPTKHAKAEQCVLTGWTYASCHNGTAALAGSIYTGNTSTPAGSQETCTTEDTYMSQTTCAQDSGHWYPPGNPPATQEGVSVTISNPGAPPVGGMCTGQIGTPPGCNANVNVPGSTCAINTWNVNECSDWNGKSNGSSAIISFFTGSTCTLSNWSPQSCKDNGGVYSPPGVGGGTPGTVAPMDTGSYTLLAPLPQLPATLDVTGTTALGNYLNIMIKIFIGICAVLAVIMILMGGIEYMSSELISSKEHGKESIRNAIFGLILALGAWLLLNTINPNLLKTDFSSLGSVAADYQPLTQAQQIANFTGSGTCTPVSNSSSPCSVTNLTGYGFVGGATEASSICNGESHGTATQASTTDVCNNNGNPVAFSYGLFQINAIANGNNIPACKGVFATSGGGTQGACLKTQNGICTQYNCSVANPNQLQTCQNYLENPDNNITFAASLLDNTSWNSWGANSSCHF